MAFKILNGKDNRATFNNIRNIRRNTRRGIQSGFTDAGKSIVKEARRTIRQDPKTGRIYELPDPVTGQIRDHQASAPGESPANFSGALASSIAAIRQVNQLQIGAGGKVVPNIFAATQIGNVDYARTLELDLNRPYLKPSIDKKQSVIKEYLGLRIFHFLTTRKIKRK